VADVLGEAAVDKIDEFLLRRIIELVRRDKLLDIDLHGSHLRMKDVEKFVNRLFLMLFL